MKRILVTVLAIALAFVPSISTYAESDYFDPALENNPFGVPIRIESTAYCDKGTTASGCEVRDGIIAGKREWLGKVAIIYKIDSEGVPQFIGFYEFKDTGSDSRIADGKCIDIWMPNEADCKAWGRQDIYIQIIDGVG